MQLFVIRHATALARPDGASDAERPLTVGGRRRARRVARALRRLGITFDRLYHSPWLRAVETADLLRGLVAGESVVTQELAHAFDLHLLEKLRGERVAIVGHERWLGELLGTLVFGAAHDGARLRLKKGAVAWLEGDLRPGGMTLRALIPPCLSEALGRRR